MHFSHYPYDLPLTLMEYVTCSLFSLRRIHFRFMICFEHATFSTGSRVRLGLPRHARIPPCDLVAGSCPSPPVEILRIPVAGPAS